MIDFSDNIIRLEQTEWLHLTDDSAAEITVDPDARRTSRHDSEALRQAGAMETSFSRSLPPLLITPPYTAAKNVLALKPLSASLTANNRCTNCARTPCLDAPSSALHRQPFLRIPHIHHRAALRLPQALINVGLAIPNTRQPVHTAAAYCTHTSAACANRTTLTHVYVLAIF